MQARPSNRQTIADLVRAAWLPALGIAALVLGALVAVHYAGAGLTLSHYDAKGHLVVARRILDSLTPGWMQIGAVWLPLPHLLSAIPVQWGFFYRTGAFGVGLSIVAFGALVYMIGRIVTEATGSPVAAAAGAGAVALNPDVLYLQATPMTEPLLMALTVASVWLGIRALRSGSGTEARLAGAAMACACMTRYEAWPVTAAFLALGFASLVRQGMGARAAARRVGGLAVLPAAAIVAFMILSRATVGAWLVQSGFFVPENPAAGRPLAAAMSVWRGLRDLASYPLALFGLAGVAAVCAGSVVSRRLAAWLPVVALAGAAALPWYAFYSGHPFRIRYMIPLIPLLGIGLGFAIGLAGRVRWLVAAAALVVLARAPGALDAAAPMVVEAQWDRAHQAGRGKVASYLRKNWDGEPIMASMGSLAHFMQELARDGYRVRDFLHEGNGDIWLAAFEDPDPHVEWMLIEEQSEGGDMLAVRARQRPRFLAGFNRVAEGGGVALYRRKPAA